jgi:YD repeat-containing protein
MKNKILCALLLLLPTFVMAGVNPKNGNFYITYTDIVLPEDQSGDHILELTRTYNSKTSKVGWFGYGWGSLYETFLVVMPDASVVVHENGAGYERYYPSQNSEKLNEGVGKIVDAAIAQDKLDHDAAEELRKQLLADEDLRRVRVAKYGIQTELPIGGKVQGGMCDVITRTPNEYLRTGCNEQVEHFDLAGRLTQKVEGSYKLDIHFSGKYPDRIEDTLGHKVYLTWTEGGNVAVAWTEKAKEAYSYDENNNLLLDNTIGGNYYRYAYDKNHNLTRIGYIDNTHMDMTYDANSLVTSVTETNGEQSKYSYRMDPDNPTSHYWTTITRISKSGEQSTQEKEFLLGKDVTGVEHLAGVTTTQGDKTQNVVMDAQGRIKRVEKPYGGFTEYSYHPTLNKLTSVVTEDGRTDFKYNATGNLVSAKNSDGQVIKLGYDSKMHIVYMLESNKTTHIRHELTFKYGPLGKPTQIKMVGKGTINVEYDEKGVISKVDSKQGAKMALEVSRAFQVLLRVVKMAGVDMGDF